MNIFRQKQKKYIFFFIFIFLLFLACFIIYGIQTGHNSKASYFSHTETREALGTVVTITLFSTEENPLTEKQLTDITNDLFNEADRLEHIFSARLNDSELSLLNSSAFISPVQVSEELFNLFDIALNYCSLSEGAFDISIGRLISLWNIGSDQPYVPSSDEISSYLNQEGWKKISLDTESKTISYEDNSISVDLGGIAKGYIGDRLKDMAENKGITCGLLSLGGNIVTIGERYTKEDWTIGITNPASPDSIIGSLKVSHMSVVTSGDYERYFVENGVKYHHILDPYTGYPSKSGISATTIIGPSSAVCDALSTACFVLGTDRGMLLIESLEDYEAVFIDSSGSIYTSSGISKYNFTANINTD